MEHIPSSEGTNFTATQQIPIPHLVSNDQSHSSPRLKWSVPFLTSFQMISPIPHLVSNDQSHSEVCEMFRKAVSCYRYQLLAPRENSKLEDTPCRLSATVFSIYQQLSISVAHFLPWLREDAPQRDEVDGLRAAPIIIIILIIIIQYFNRLFNSHDFRCNYL